MRRTLARALLVVLTAAFLLPCRAEPESSVTLTILHDNYAHRAEYRAEWGFSCLIEGLERTILFDVGGPECSIRTNLQVAGIDPASIDAIAFSHAHADHIGGFECLFPAPSSLTLYVPSFFPLQHRQRFAEGGEAIVMVSGPTEICPDALLTGAVVGPVIEEALCVRSPSGLLVITGCAHPGIVRMVEAAQSLFPGETVALVLGGFHLLQEDEATLRTVAQQLLELGAERVAPTHCSGDLARAVFREIFGAGYVEAGVGLELTF